MREGTPADLTAEEIVANTLPLAWWCWWMWWKAGHKGREGVGRTGGLARAMGRGTQVGR